MTHYFRDVRFMPAAEKKATLQAWIRFLKGGLQFSQFTNALYNHLIQHCSFIGHFNRAEFYSYYFESGDSVALFLSQFDSRGPCLSVEYGDRRWLAGDYRDINRAMIAEASRIIPSLVNAARQRQKVRDFEAASALLAKHGIMLEGLREPGICDDSKAREEKNDSNAVPAE